VSVSHLAENDVIKAARVQECCPADAYLAVTATISAEFLPFDGVVR